MTTNTPSPQPTVGVDQKHDPQTRNCVWCQKTAPEPWSNEIGLWEINGDEFVCPGCLHRRGSRSVTAEPRQPTKQERRYLKTVDRRIAYLNERLADSSGPPTARDRVRQELCALKWARDIAAIAVGGETDEVVLNAHREGRYL